MNTTPNGSTPDGFRDLIARTADLGGHREAATRELATAMAYVLLARDGGRSAMSATATAQHLVAIAAAADMSATDLHARSDRARPWFRGPTPLVGILSEAGTPLLDTYLTLFADAVTFAANVEPVDLPSLAAARDLINAQRGTERPPLVPDRPKVRNTGHATPTREAGTGTRTVAPRPLADLYAELDALVGLTEVKTMIRQQAELLRVQALRASSGLASTVITRHMVFTGNPGTGKTTVARLVAQIYASIQAIPTGHLIEVDKSGLVAGYVGQSEEKTAAILNEADGGVLFIDEAYALVGDQFGESVIDLIVKAAEDRRDTLVIILAGYTTPMVEFINANPGLESRFRTVIEFPDYTTDELVTVFERIVDKSDYTLAHGTLDTVRTIIASQPRDESFGNARFVRNLFEQAVLNHAWRLRTTVNPGHEDLTTLTPDDVTPPPPVPVQQPG
jgi:Holliday junction resolvasome RuvABC ATP-dependent DNA helicase subunit